MPMHLNAEQLRILRHMLGIDDPWQRIPQPSRDYYCANPENAELIELERVGAVVRYRVCEHYWWYHCTEQGRSAAMASCKLIRKPVASRRYRLFLQVRDCLPDLTFHAFLTDSEFREVRLSA